MLHLQRKIYPQCFGLLDNQDKNKSNKIISICGFFYQTCTFLKKIFRMINLARKSKCNFKHDLIFSGLNQPFTSAIHIDFSSMIVMNFECNCVKGAKVKATGHFYQRSSSWSQYHKSVPCPLVLHMWGCQWECKSRMYLIFQILFLSTVSERKRLRRSVKSLVSSRSC